MRLLGVALVELKPEGFGLSLRKVVGSSLLGGVVVAALASLEAARVLVIEGRSVL